MEEVGVSKADWKEDGNNNRESSGSLLFEEADPLIEFCLMNFLFCVHENLLNDIARNARIANCAKIFGVIIS